MNFKKVVLDYDETGMGLYIPLSGQFVGTATAPLDGCIVDEQAELSKTEAVSECKVDKMIKLTNAGFDAEDVCEMLGKGLL